MDNASFDAACRQGRRRRALFRARAGAGLGASGHERPALRHRPRARQRRPGDAGGRARPSAPRASSSATSPISTGSSLADGPDPPSPPTIARNCRGLARRWTRAAEGVDVAVVSGGDPGVFAMAAAVCEAIEAGPPEWRDIELTVVPGVTAMLAVAARIGAPLGHDFCAISLSDNLKPWELIERRLDAASQAGFVIALYNPISKARPWQLGRAFECLRAQSARLDAGDLRARRRPARRAHRERAARRGRPGQRRHGDLRHHRLGRDADHRARRKIAAGLHAALFPAGRADDRPARSASATVCRRSRRR